VLFSLSRWCQVRRRPRRRWLAEGGNLFLQRRDLVAQTGNLPVYRRAVDRHSLARPSAGLGGAIGAFTAFTVEPEKTILHAIEAVTARGRGQRAFLWPDLRLRRGLSRSWRGRLRLYRVLRRWRCRFLGRHIDHRLRRRGRKGGGKNAAKYDSDSRQR